jgi:hypothetical protein
METRQGDPPAIPERALFNASMKAECLSMDRVLQRPPASPGASDRPPMAAWRAGVTGLLGWT